MKSNYGALFANLQVALVVKKKTLPANAGDTKYWGSIPGLGRSPEEGMAIHSNILA